MVAVFTGLVLVSLAAWHRAALIDFRAVERVYVQSRQPSACVIRELATRIDERNPRPELITEDLPSFLGAASEDIAATEGEIRSTTTIPFPGLGAARDEVAASIEAGAQFYEALLLTPAESEDELETFRTAVGRSEDALGTSRRWLLVSPGAGWDDRTECPG
jgi:hypothetical protein